MLAEAEETGVIEEAEEEMIYKVFDFAEKEVHDVMVPRPEVVGVSVDLPAAGVPGGRHRLARTRAIPPTAAPSTRSSASSTSATSSPPSTPTGSRTCACPDILRPAHFVPETKDLGPLLTEFRRTNQHMAIVIDEYGSTHGIVTLEDLLEEIVGEIEDEYDMPDDSVEQLDDRHIRVDGTFPIDDFNEQFGKGLPQEDYHTLAGFVFGELGRAPETGDEITWDGLRFEVVQTDGPRIERLEIEFLENWEANEPEESEEAERKAS